MTRRNPPNKRTCSVKGCGRKHYGRGLCSAHYWRTRRENADPCPIDDCQNPQRAKGLCMTHYKRKRREDADPCTKDDCQNPQDANGLCMTHYNQRRHANADPCTIDDCQNPQEANGLCDKHYQRLSNHGDPHFNAFEANGPVPHVVYLFWDADGNPLYIGLTVNMKERHGQHARTKRWWDKVDRIDQIDCASRDEADALETKLIVELRPRYNKAKKPPNCQARRP